MAKARKTRTPPTLPKSVRVPYTGGHTVLHDRYIWELCPNHPKANHWGFVQQHRLVVERRIGHYLPAGMLVHHKDRVKTNNEDENLEPMTKSRHMAEHREEKRLRFQKPLDAQMVEMALQKYRSTKKAATSLGVALQTLHNRYPALVQKYMRRRPHKPYDPITIERVVTFFRENEKVGYRECSAKTGVSYRTAQRICEEHGILWYKRKNKATVVTEEMVREALDLSTSLHEAARRLHVGYPKLLRGYPALVAEFRRRAILWKSIRRVNKNGSADRQTSLLDL